MVAVGAVAVVAVVVVVAVAVEEVVVAMEAQNDQCSRGIFQNRS